MRLALLMRLGSPWSREAAARLAYCGHEVHVIDFQADDAETYISCRDSFQTVDIREFKRSIARVHTLEPRFSSRVGYLMSARALNNILTRIKADALVTLYGGGFATMAYMSGFRPYAVYIVGSDVLLGGRIKRAISRLVLNAAELVFVNGRYLTLKAKTIASRANTRCLYLGTDTDVFKPGSPLGRPVKIICTRGFSRIYNNEYLIRALAEMPDLAQSYEVIFASSGPQLEEVRSLADKVLSPEQRERVKFLGGIARDCMVSALQNSHVYVSVSRSDGASISLMEALACGLFPVLSDIPPNREWISDYAENGILVPLDQPEKLAAALVRAVCNTEARKKAARFNRNLALHEADSRKNMEFLAVELDRMILGAGAGMKESGIAH